MNGASGLQALDGRKHRAGPSGDVVRQTVPARVGGSLAIGPDEFPAVRAAVDELPMLPHDAHDDRYGIRRLTARWLHRSRRGKTRSVHTRKAYFRELAGFLQWCQRQGLDPLTARQADLDEFQDYRSSDQGAGEPAPATVARTLAALSSWYQYLVANTDGRVSRNPLDGVERPHVPDQSPTLDLTPEQVDALIAAADRAADQSRDTLADAEHAAVTAGKDAEQATRWHRNRHLATMRDRALIRILADLGPRSAEVRDLNLDSLTSNGGQRTIRFVGKGGVTHERPLLADAALALDQYLAARAHAAGTTVAALVGPLLATTRADGSPGRLVDSQIFDLIRRLATDAGIPDPDRASPHSLRHSFATHSNDLGAPLTRVQKAMGHADPRTTRRYQHERDALRYDPAHLIAADRARRAMA